MAYFKVSKNPSDDFSMTNRVFLNNSEWNSSQNKYILIQISSKKFIFKAETDSKVPNGGICLNGSQRKWMYVGIGESVQCFPHNFSSKNVMLTELVVEIDLFVKSQVLKDPMDSDKLACRFLERFYDIPVTANQIILFNADNINFEVTVKSLRGFDIKKSNAETEAIDIGLIQSNTVIKFDRKPDAKLMLTGRSKASVSAVNILNPNWDFNSIGVGGLDEEFSQIFRRAFISRLLPPEYVSELGLKHVRGILLYGPPGTGKTLTARQIGRMLNAREPKIVNGPSILDKYVGESEANIRKLFADAEEEFKRMGNQSALHIIIFDEIDAICKARGSLSGGSAVQDTVVNQLLSKMDGVEQLNNILVIGMTNRRDMIDEALLRPGRMGVQIEVPLPSEGGRLQIFEIHTKKLKEKNILADDVDLSEFARLTKNYSGAEIEGLVMAALSNAQIEKFDPKKGMAIRTEDLESFKISRTHFIYALEHDVKAFFGRHESELQEFIENPIIVWSPEIAELVEEASLLIKSLREGERVNKMTVLLHGASHSGKTALAVHLAQQTEFTFVRMCSIKNMIGFSESGRCIAIKKIFDDALKAPTSVIILDDLEHLIDYSSIGPRFSINLVKNLIGMIACYVPKNKKMLIIGTTEHLSAMHELGLYSAFGKNGIKVPQIKRPSEVMSVLQEQDLFDHSELAKIDEDLKMDLSTNMSIGIKQLVNECNILKSVEKNIRVNKLLVKLKASGDEFDF